MASTPSPSRRRPRRSRPAIYMLRVELDDVEPAIWRRFTVQSDLMLDALHPVLQIVMGWTDSHLHGFVSGEDPRSPESERFEVRSPYAEPLGSGPTGYAAQAYEDEVRLDGARACPPEDCGGVPGYENLLAVLASPGDPEEQDLRRWLTMVTGRPDFDSEAFDAAAVSVALRTQAEVAALIQDGDTLLGTLLKRLPRSRAPELYRLLPAAGVGEGVAMTGEEVERATLHLRWLLRVIGPDGLALTGAGYRRRSWPTGGRSSGGPSGGAGSATARATTIRCSICARPPASWA